MTEIIYMYNNMKIGLSVRLGYLYNIIIIIVVVIIIINIIFIIIIILQSEIKFD